MPNKDSVVDQYSLVDAKKKHLERQIRNTYIATVVVIPSAFVGMIILSVLINAGLILMLILTMGSLAIVSVIFSVAIRELEDEFSQYRT